MSYPDYLGYKHRTFADKMPKLVSVSLSKLTSVLNMRKNYFWYNFDCVSPHYKYVFILLI